MYQIPEALPLFIFRTYDIRGEVGENCLSENVAYAVGLAIGVEALAVDQHQIAVGCDARLSGAMIKKALIAGIIETGCDVIDIGVGPTPLLYFATSFLPTKTGVMVTASHNPSNHNGFKIVLNGRTLSEEGIQKLVSRIQAKIIPSQKHGRVTTQDISEDYIAAICKNITLQKKMKIVVDAGNGAASIIAPIVYRRLGCEVIELFCNYDGHFPNHHPDPTIPANLKQVIALVKKEKADIGLAFDGDGDRLGIVDNHGDVIWPDRQLMILVEDVLEKHPGEKIVFDVKCSRVLPEIIKKYGGVPVMSRTGHSVLKARMIEEKSPLAGEMSGHIFFKDGWYGFDDGIYVGARLLSVLSRSQQTVSEIFDALPQTINTPELKLPIAEEEKSVFMQQLAERANFGFARKITIDGLRIEYDFGWGLIRPSNTSPYLILRFEADTEKNLEKIKEIFRVQLLCINPALQLPF